MESFAIATLTCNDRETLFDTLQSFFDNTDIGHITILNDKVVWCIFIQGYTDEYLHKLETKTAEYESSYDVQFNLVKSRENLGLSKGANKLAESVKDYDLVLHLEDDWHCLSSDITGLSKQWLETSISFLIENHNVSTLFLRKYVDDREKQQYAWSRHANYTNHKHKDNFNYAEKMKGSNVIDHRDVKFQEIPKFLFTFNPHIRRNHDYYNVKVFPLDEYPDVSNRRGAWKLTQYGDVPKWGWCEAQAMEKTRELTTYNVGAGVFGHNEDWTAAGKI